jgi:hypothetical protein
VIVFCGFNITANRLTRPISEYLPFTLAAQITSLPILLNLFGRLSLTSLLANHSSCPSSRR